MWRVASAWGDGSAASASNIVERRCVYPEPGMAGRATGRLPLASLGRLLLCPPWQLRPGNATRAADRSVVLPAGPPDVQPVARLPRRQAARPACVDRGERHRRLIGQEHGGRGRCAARARRHPAQRRPLAAPSRASVPDGPQACSGAGVCDRRAHPRAGVGERPRRRTPLARPPPVALVADAEQDPGAVGLQAGTGRRAARGRRQPTRDGV